MNILRNHSIHCNNISIIILFTKNFKHLFFVLLLVKKTKVLCGRWVSNRNKIPTKHKLRIKPWYFRIQQNWAIILQVYVTHFEYWLLSKFSHLTARQNKSHPGREMFRIWTQGNNIFFPVKQRETTGKLFPNEQPLKKTNDNINTKRNPFSSVSGFDI